MPFSAGTVAEVFVGTGFGASGLTTISTRRLALSGTPSAVGRAGFNSPKALVSIFLAETPRADKYLATASARISRKPGKFKRLLTKYADRFMLGTDLVITEHPRKSSAWIGTRFRAYLNMLAMASCEVDFLPGRQFRGLGLSGEVLERILYRNYETFVASRPRGTVITRDVDWARMGVARTGREAGTTIPTAEPPAKPMPGGFKPYQGPLR